MFVLGHNGHLIGTGGRITDAALFTVRRIDGGGIDGGRAMVTGLGAI
jgi:hypothetical protein